MKKNLNPKTKVLSFKHLPMDLARIVCSVLIPIYRIKRITPSGEKYENKLSDGAIIASNHTSFADPFLVGVTFWYRRMFFLVGEAVMVGKLRPLLIKGVGGIKIEREKTDLDAIKKSVEVLKNGHLLAIFPQGGINKQDCVDTIKSGAVLIALQAGVPIIPMYICPKGKWFQRRKVIIGDALNPKELCNKKMPSTNDIADITHKLTGALQECINSYAD